ncbi:MAG: hypothetical protein LBV45_04750, partial [Xanthomonadaceae bacterium]|nr:hypothetical protein [Xanthomonadaceae bacterium]
MSTGSLNGIDILFVAGFGPITRAATQEQSRQLYQDTLRLPLQSMDGNPGYLHSDRIDGVKHLALWPLTQASQSCFGIDDWPEHLPAPQCWLELEAADLVAATATLKAAAYALLP